MEKQQVIDRDWFFRKLEEKHRSVRGLARHLDVDASAVSRMLSGKRKMKMEEANQIALFLGAPVSEVLKHAGVAIDLDGQPTRILLAATIDEGGHIHRLMEPKPLPQSVIERAQAAIGQRNGKVIAAQIRATTGALSVMDDAVVLFAPTEIVDADAIGALSICRTQEGEQFFGRVERARKTGEAYVVCPTGKETECILVTAAPVLAIIP